MKIRDDYEIRPVIAPIDSTGMILDIYNDFDEFTRDNPDEKFKIGFVVTDIQTGWIVNECNDWNDTMEDALKDFHEHVESLPIEVLDNLVTE